MIAIIGFAHLFKAVLQVTWLIIPILFLILLLTWFLVSPLELTIDSRIPAASMEWISIGKAKIIYEKNEWWLSIRLPFYHRKWMIKELVFKNKSVRQKKVNAGKGKVLPRLFRVIRTFRVKHWQVAIDTGDTVRNAFLYPLNFLPSIRHHLYVNFKDENFVAITIRNQPWRILFAWIK